MADNPGPAAATSRHPFESVSGILLTEPRIEAIRRELLQLLRIVQFERGGKPVEVDAFRLRNIADWADYPASMSEMFWHLSSVCNFQCEFCYEKGNPPEFPIRNTPRMTTCAEVATRLRHYDPLRKQGIFVLRTAINEPFANKHAVQYLRMMRERSPDELISFVTNGAYLDEGVIAALAGLRPIFFNLSIYSVDPETRRTVLHDHRGSKAVDAVPLLSQYRLPYMTNVVMWPSISFDDLERTVAYTAAHGATLMRVCLGGYSRYLPGDVPRFDPADFWPRVGEAVAALRERYAMPILIEPSAWERPDTDAVIDGVIDGSPAQLAGIRRGDRATAINGEPIGTRTELASRLRRAATGMHSGVVHLQLARGAEEIAVSLDRWDARCTSYPYAEIAAFDDFMFGLVLTDTLRYSSIRAAREILIRESFRSALLLTSELMEPVLSSMLARSQAFDGFDVAIRVPQNRYFGGTINAGDLLVVTDFIEAIEAYRGEGRPDPDVVLIPASPFASSPWGRDLTGRPWTDIERLARIPVRRIPCPTITC